MPRIPSSLAPFAIRALRRALLGAGLALLGASAQAGEIAVIVKTTNSSFWQNVNKGADAAIKETTGHTLTFSGPASESAVADQVNLVENAVNRRVAGIVLAPSDPDALVPAIKRAWEARIPVVLIDSRVSDAGKTYYQSFLSTDNTAAGELCAKALIARVAGDELAIREFLQQKRHLFVPVAELESARDALQARIDREKLGANPLFIDLEDKDPEQEAKDNPHIEMPSAAIKASLFIFNVDRPDLD